MVTRHRNEVVDDRFLRDVEVGADDAFEGVELRRQDGSCLFGVNLDDRDAVV